MREKVTLWSRINIGEKVTLFFIFILQKSDQLALTI